MLSDLIHQYCPIEINFHPPHFQLPGRPRQTGSEGLPADRAGHPEDEGEDNGHRRSPLLLQEPQLQAVRRRRTAIRTEEMDSLF